MQKNCQQEMINGIDFHAVQNLTKKTKQPHGFFRTLLFHLMSHICYLPKQNKANSL